MTYNENILIENLNSLSISYNMDLLNELDVFSDMLIEKNKVMNLTAITDPEGIAIKHFADSLSVFSAVPISDSSKIIDIGTGAGFPGLPMLIYNKTLDITLLDSTAKRLNFIHEVLDKLNLNAELLHSRAEEAGNNIKYREHFDFAVSRAVASLNVLCEYCLPFVKVGGIFLALKSAQSHEEIINAGKALSTLGGRIVGEKSFSFTNHDSRNILIIEKIAPTPPKYPRPSAQISRKPL